MRKAIALLLSALWTSIPAQEGPTFNQNGLGLHNHRLHEEPVEFPGFREPGGTQAGDCVWKVFPPQALLTAKGSLHLSGFEVALEDLDPSTPLQHPDLHLYQGRRNARGVWLPDFETTLVKIRLGPIALPQGQPGEPSGVWRINWSLAHPIEVAVSCLQEDRALAAALMAPPGEGPLDGARLRLTAGENYAKTPQGSFSGYHDARTGKTALADGTWQGPRGAYPAGELWLRLGFVEPILQPWATSALVGSFLEQDAGPGALWTDLASGEGPEGRLGWRLESWADGVASTRRYAFLLLNLHGRPARSFWVPGMARPLALDPREPALALLVAGGIGVGPITDQRPEGWAPDFWFGRFATPAVPFPKHPILIGSDWWVGALVADLDQGVLGEVANTCVVHIR